MQACFESKGTKQTLVHHKAIKFIDNINLYLVQNKTWIFALLLILNFNHSCYKNNNNFGN